jgi:hypothetical protein
MRERAGPKTGLTAHRTRTMHTLQPISANSSLLHPILIATQLRIENRDKPMYPKEKTFSNSNKNYVFSRLPALRSRKVFLLDGSIHSDHKTSKINRNIALIESPVSRSKQKAAPQINRNISATLPLRIFPFHFSIFHLHGETPSVDLNFGVWFRASGALPCVTRRASSGTLEGAFSCPMK